MSRSTRASEVFSGSTSDGTPERWVPRAYMKIGVRLIVSRGAVGLLLDPGMGKTAIVLAALTLLLKKKVVNGALVIAPLRAMTSVWPKEVARWSNFNHLRISILHGSRKEKALREPADLYLINPEGLAWLEHQRWSYPDMLVVDESTRFKHARTERFKTLRRMLPKFKRRVILTGTPAPNGLLDLFGQIYILDFGRALGRFITHYRQTYFFPTGYGGYKWVPFDDSEKRIYKRIAPLVLRLDEKDYLTLPKLIKTSIEVELPPKARRTYERLKKEFLIQLDEGLVEAYNAASLTTKLRQVANGWVYAEGVGSKRRVAQVHRAKIDALAELIEELQGQPLLVAYEFQHERDAIAKELKLPWIGGGVSAKRGLELEDRWNAGELPALLVHPQSVPGLNLQFGGRYLTWFGITWDLEAYEQLVRRLWRSGQTKPVHVYHLVAFDTIDEVIMTFLRRKRRTQKALLDALRKMRR